ncbi:hypothetical protein pb186bvf_000457 [Paramecium bursaria]
MQIYKNNSNSILILRMKYKDQNLELSSVVFSIMEIFSGTSMLFCPTNIIKVRTPLQQFLLEQSQQVNNQGSEELNFVILVLIQILIKNKFNQKLIKINFYFWEFIS